MTSIGQFRKLLPKPIEATNGRKNNFATSVRAVLFLTKIIPKYEKITYKEFVDDFQKFVELTESEEDPCLYCQSGEHEGELKIPNLDTLRDTWVKRYNFNEDFEKFEAEATYEIATNVMQNTIRNIPEENEQDKEIHDGMTELQKDVLDDDLLSYKDKAYINRACQDTKNGLNDAVNKRYEQAKDYKNIIDERHSINAQTGEPTRVNSNSIIERYNELQEKMKQRG